jgi:hypothetical protein
MEDQNFQYTFTWVLVTVHQLSSRYWSVRGIESWVRILSAIGGLKKVCTIEKAQGGGIRA